MKHIKQKTTKDYSKFHLLPMNREIQAVHVEKMVSSIRNMGCIRDVIVAVTNLIDGITRCYIIDGQHLFTACQREGLPIVYRAVKINTDEELVEKMAALNNTSKSWNLINYVNAWKYVNTDYMTLLKYINLYNLEPSMIAMIAMNQTNATGTSRLIKKGEFVISNSKTAEMCKAFSDFFIKIGTADRWIKFNFLSVFTSEYGKYDHAKALLKLDKHLSTIKAMGDPKYAQDYIRKNIFY
jgi:hypothetical protein